MYHSGAATDTCWTTSPRWEPTSPRSPEALDARTVHDRAAGLSASAASLKTDLELARAEACGLRQERDQLKAALQRSLGHQLDQLGNADLLARVDELTEAAQRLTGERDAARAETSSLQLQVSALEDDLAAARTSLRRMVREGNLPAQ